MHSILSLLRSGPLHAPASIPAAQLQYLDRTLPNVQLLEAPNYNFGSSLGSLGDRTIVFWSTHPGAVA